MRIDDIFKAHEADLAQVERRLMESFETDVTLLNLIGRHILGSGGKRLRPLFLIKSARLAGYTDGDAHIALGSVIETIHTASLLHDDVVDGADTRRGQPAAHALWGNPVVVLAGDYLYSNALRLAVRHQSLPVMGALSTAVSMMAEGELLQLQKAGDVALTEEEYLRIVGGKTGILFSTACRIGAILGRCDSAREDALAHYGMCVGKAFQVADDVLDYQADPEEFGKDLGTDLGEGKLTLPLIYLLEAASKSERADIENIIESEEIMPEDLKRIIALLNRYEIIGRVYAKARGLVDEAIGTLGAFAPSQERDALAIMAEFALVRGK